MYNDLCDNEIIYMIRCGNKKGYEILQNKYKNAIYLICLEGSRICKGLDINDFIQEINLLLFSVVARYNECKGNFFSFFYLCAKRHCHRIVKDYFDNNLTLSFDCLSLENYVDDKIGVPLIDCIVSDYDFSDPAVVYYVKESSENYGKAQKQLLSKKENEYYELFKQGLSNKKIAELKNVDLKVVCNTITRAKNKLLKYTKKNNQL